MPNNSVLKDKMCTNKAQTLHSAGEEAAACVENKESTTEPAF